MVTLAEVTDAAAQVLGLTLIVAAIAAAAAFVYRWYVRERLPDGLAVLLGLSVVAVSIGTTGWLNQVIGGSDALLSAGAALGNIGVFVVCAAGATVGARIGNRLSGNVAAATGTTVLDAEVSSLVEAVGRVITVDLPEEIDDVVGYDPVSPRTKEALEGKTFLFPRRLTVAELRERLIARLRTDYAVGHVDVELAADGTVEYLALGSRAAGIGPTLPPETAAVAIRADPAYAASAGDLVQVWESNPSRRVLTAELRGTTEDDVVTLAIDAADTPKLDPETRYRLVTLPVDDRPDREFASLLRAADETLATVEVREGSPLVGRTVRDVGVSLAAITDHEDGTTTLPTSDRTVTAGDVLYAIGTPDALRKLEDAATPGAQSGGESVDVTPPPAAHTAPEVAKTATDEADRATDEAGTAMDKATTTRDDVPVVESIREAHTPVFTPESERDPLVDAAPDETASDGDDEGDHADEAGSAGDETRDAPADGDRATGGDGDGANPDVGKADDEGAVPPAQPAGDEADERRESDERADSDERAESDE